MAEKTDQITFRMREGVREKLDELRRAELDIPTRSEMLNRVVERMYARIRGEERRKEPVNG